jgi:hypothetical protein
MGGDNKEKKPDVPAHVKVNKGQHNHQGGHRHRNRWNNAAGGGSTNKFVGKTPGLENNIFDNTGAHDAHMFHCSITHITDYIQLNYCNKVSEAIRSMTPVKIEIPEVPKDKPDPDNPNKIIKVTEIDIYWQKEKHKKASAKFNKYETDMTRAFILIYHQCTPTLRNDLEATGTWVALRTAQDPISIALKGLIQSLCCSYDAKMQSIMATVASHKKLFTYYQRDGVDNRQYFQEFTSHYGTLETYGGIGAIGITPAFLTAKLQELALNGTISSATNPTDAEQKMAILLV